MVSPIDRWFLVRMDPKKEKFDEQKDNELYEEKDNELYECISQGLIVKIYGQLSEHYSSIEAYNPLKEAFDQIFYKKPSIYELAKALNIIEQKIDKFYLDKNEYSNFSCQVFKKINFDKISTISELKDLFKVFKSLKKILDIDNIEDIQKGYDLLDTLSKLIDNPDLFEDEETLTFLNQFLPLIKTYKHKGLNAVCSSITVDLFRSQIKKKSLNILNIHLLFKELSDNEIEFLAEELKILANSLLHKTTTKGLLLVDLIFKKLNSILDNFEKEIVEAYVNLSLKLIKQSEFKIAYEVLKRLPNQRKYRILNEMAPIVSNNGKNGKKSLLLVIFCDILKYNTSLSLYFLNKYKDQLEPSLEASIRRILKDCVNKSLEELVKLTKKEGWSKTEEKSFSQSLLDLELSQLDQDQYRQFIQMCEVYLQRLKRSSQFPDEFLINKYRKYKDIFKITDLKDSLVIELINKNLFHSIQTNQNLLVIENLINLLFKQCLVLPKERFQEITKELLLTISHNFLLALSDKNTPRSNLKSLYNIFNEILKKNDDVEKPSFKIISIGDENFKAKLLEYLITKIVFPLKDNLVN